LTEPVDYYKLCRNYASRYRVSPDQREDLVQEGYLAYLECVDKGCSDPERFETSIRQAMYGSAQAVLEQFPSIKYLEYTDYVFEGVKMYGLPITPSFHRQNWAFNADRGDEIKKYVDRIPKDVNILISHGPPYGILDTIPEEYKLTLDEDIHRGCEELRTAMQRRLIDLKLSCFGHIHGNTGVIVAPISNTRHIIFSNGAVINDQYKLVVKKPLIINL